MMFYVQNFGFGLIIGTAWLAMLWWAVRLLVSHPRGAMLYGLLVPVRFGLLAAAFLLVARQQAPTALLAALAGLVAVRLVGARLVRPGPGRPQALGP